MNVTARLQTLAKDTGHPLLVSRDFLHLLDRGNNPPTPDYLVEVLRPTQLRGRTAALEVFSVARRGPANV